MPIRIGRGTTRTTCSALSPSITSNTKNTRLVSREKWPDEGRKGLGETIAPVVDLELRLRSPAAAIESVESGRSAGAATKKKGKKARRSAAPPKNALGDAKLTATLSHPFVASGFFPFTPC